MAAKINKTAYKDIDLDSAKERAMEYVKQGKLGEAVMSMVSDLEKIGRNNPMLGILMMDAKRRADDGNKEAVINFIQGF